MRILIADDHDVVRQGIRRLLEGQPGWEISGEAADGREAVRKAQQLRPDLVIMDISMPELNGVDATRQIMKALPGTEVLILTMHHSEQLLREMLAAGARGYVLKSDAGRDLLTAIRALQEGKPFFSSQVSQTLMQSYVSSVLDGRVPAGARRLTPREREIVQLLAEGKSNKQIAFTLNISIRTVESHRNNIMRKLDLHSFSELLRYAIRNKLVQV